MHRPRPNRLADPRGIVEKCRNRLGQRASGAFTTFSPPHMLRGQKWITAARMARIILAVRNYPPPAITRQSHEFRTSRSCGLSIV